MGKHEGEKKDVAKSSKKPSKGNEETKKKGHFLSHGDHKIKDYP